jgi:hypothetical protein
VMNKLGRAGRNDCAMAHDVTSKAQTTSRIKGTRHLMVYCGLEIEKYALFRGRVEG